MQGLKERDDEKNKGRRHQVFGKSLVGEQVVIRAIGIKCRRWLQGHKKMLFLIGFLTCRVETAQIRSVQKGSWRVRTNFWSCFAVKQWPDGIVCWGEKLEMAEVSREDGEQSAGSALVLLNVCSAPLQNLILVSSWRNRECELSA